MNNKTQILKVVGGIGLFLAMIYGLLKYKGPNVEQNPIEVTTTTDTVDSTYEVKIDMQEQYDVQVQELSDSIIKLHFRLHDYEQQIQKKNTKANEKVNTIVSTDAQQLVKFLSDRYKDSIQ